MQNLPGASSGIRTAALDKLLEPNASAIFSFQKSHPANPLANFRHSQFTMTCKNLKDPDNTFLSSIVYRAAGKLMQRIFLPRHKQCAPHQGTKRPTSGDKAPHIRGHPKNTLKMQFFPSVKLCDKVFDASKEAIGQKVLLF